MILAIDFGSTSFKAGLFDRKLRQVGGGSAPLRYRYASGGRVELDVAVVEAAVRRALPKELAGIDAIAITSQAQTFTVLDRQGRATRPFVSWQDGRAGKACERLKRKLPDFAEHSSFADLWPVLQVCQLHHAPARRGELVVKLPTYFVRLWIGEAVIDDNLAAMSGLYSLQLRDWWPAAAGPTLLPRVIPVGSVAGVTRPNKFGLPVGVPVVLAGNDQTAGAYAAQLEAKHAALLTLGTAQVVYACCRRMPRPKPGLIRGPYPGGLFYRMAADGYGANVANWAETVLAGCETHDKFFAQAVRSPAGCHGLSYDADQGAWLNLGMHHTSADMARAILECLTKRMAGMLAQIGVTRRQRLLVAGGGSQRQIWRKILSVAVGERLTRTEVNPLIGAARMGSEFGRQEKN